MRILRCSALALALAACGREDDPDVLLPHGAAATSDEAPLEDAGPARFGGPVPASGGGDAPDGGGEWRRVAGRDEQRALAVREQLAGRGRVGRDERCPAGERLKRLVRDHARGLRRRTEHAERAARLPNGRRQVLVLDPRRAGHVRWGVPKEARELPAADDSNRNVRDLTGGRQNRLESVKRDQLPHEQHVE